MPIRECHRLLVALVILVLLAPTPAQACKHCESSCDGNFCGPCGVIPSCEGDCDKKPAPGNPECSCTGLCATTPGKATCSGPPDRRTDRDAVCGSGVDSQCTSSPGVDCSKPDCSKDTCSALCALAAQAKLGGHDPIQLKTRAALTEAYTDFEVEGVVRLGITRTYSSADVSVRGPVVAGAGIGSPFGGPFGQGWHHQWEAVLYCNSQDACRVVQGLDETMMFRWSARAVGAGELSGETLDLYVRSDTEALTAGDQSRLVRRPSGEFILYRTDGVDYHFEPDCGHDYCSATDNFCKDPWQGGLLHVTRVVDQRGNTIRVSYDRPSGSLLSLTDDLGHRLELRAAGNACANDYNSKAQALLFDGVKYVEYQYSGSQLVAARQPSPDGHGPVMRSYEYGRPGYLVRIRNEAGDPIVEFGYDDHGYATSVVDRESKVNVSYPDETTATGSTASGGTFGFSGGASAGVDGGGGGGGNGPGGAILDTSTRGLFASIGRALRCVEDPQGRTHWLDRDAYSRVIHHAVYARDVYDCKATEPPVASAATLLEEWFAYGLRKQIAEDFSVELNTKTSVLRRSVRSGHLAVQHYDYDQSHKGDDPVGYQCAPGGSSPFLMCRQVESGYSLDLSGATIPEQHTTFFSYDSRGRLVKTIGPITTIGAIPPGTVDPVEERTYWPDSGTGTDLPRLGRLREIRRYPTPGSPALVTSYDYDVFGPYQVVEANGRMTLLAKDGRGRIVGLAMPDGRALSIRYYDESWPRTVVRSSGATVRMSYDLRGRLALAEYLESDPEAVIPTSAAGNPTAPVVWSQSWDYDEEGNAYLIQLRDSQGVVRRKQAREYGFEHQVRRGRHPEAPAKFWELSYDSAGNPSQLTDEEGRVIALTPDALGRPVNLRRSGVALTGNAVSLDVGTYSYEGDTDLLERVTDGAGGTTSYSHDDFGRLLTVDSAAALEAGGARYTYDARGNVVSRSFGSTTITYRYDGLDRITSLEAVSSAGAPGVSYAFKYDENSSGAGRLTSVTDSRRTTVYEYDEVGRVRFERVTESALTSPLVTELRYDADGQLDTIVYPTGLTVRYTRDPATGRPVAVANAGTGGSYASGISYWPGGPLRGMTFGNGQSFSETVNLRYEPLSISSGPLTLGYVPSLAGDVAALSSPQGTELFGYDFADRLVSRTADTGARSDPFSVVYAGARMVQLLGRPSGIPKYAFGYDEQSNVSSVSGYDPSGASIVSTMCMIHDALGRPVLVGYAQAASNGVGTLGCRKETDVREVIARFRYDFANRRVARQDASGEWTYFGFIDGQVLAEMTGSGAAKREYVWLDGTPLAQVEHAGDAAYAYYYHVDHLGTPRAMTNASGQTVWSASALPYGEVVESAGTDPLSGKTVVTNLRLPGQYDERLLGSLGLQGPYYNWNRWYLPGVGRYLEPDPVAMSGLFNTRYGVDWYGYANQNPLRWTDPLGLYGTNSCEYYQQRCLESGGKYYCEQAPYWCDWFPKYPDPDPNNPDPNHFEGWARCTRQCLQDCDHDKNKDQNSCPVTPDNRKGPWDPRSESFDCHAKCYSQCGVTWFGHNYYLP